MKIKALFLVKFTILIFLCSCNRTQDKQKITSGLWSPVEPYKTGFLKVSEIHELYYELCGNPKGKPVIVLHGGPGGGCWPVMRQFFNPEKFLIVLYDQRGATRSKPFASIEENTTWDLVEDIEKLRKHLGLEKMMLVGGSWGSTLALVYSETYPERVTEMVLRGIWTSTQQEIDHFYHGGVSGIFPDAYYGLLNSLPDTNQRPLPAYLLGLLINGDAPTRKKIADAWLKYEWRISDLEVKVKEIDEWCSKNDSYAFSLIENYYMANHCFLEEGQIWNNLDKIKHIPVIIINGRYDMPCNPVTAYHFHHNLPKSELIIVEKAGHGGEAIMNAEADAVRKFEN